MSTLLSDTFSGSLNSLLTGHTSDLGTGWTKAASGYYAAGNDLKLTGAGQVYSPDGNCGIVDSNAIPPASEYDIEFDLVFRGGYGGMSVVFRHDTTTDSFYRLNMGPGVGWHAEAIVNGGGAGTTDLTSGSFGAFVDNTPTHVKIEVRDAYKRLYRDGTLVWDSSNNSITGAGRIGLASQLNANLSNGTFLSNFVVSSVAGPLTAGVLTELGHGPNGIAILGTAASGGTPGYSETWHVGTSAGFTPSGLTLVASKTDLNIAITGLAPATTYYVKRVSTDSASASVTSNELAITTDVAYAFNTFAWGDIGDSTTGATVSRMVTLIAAGAGRPVINIDRAVSGKSTVDFLPSNATTNYLRDAKLLFLAKGVTHVSNMLGLNDAGGSRSADDYGVNLALICNDLVAAGFTVINDYQTYRTDNTAYDALLVGYQAKIDAIANGTTIRRGDTTAYSQFMANPGWLADGLHPSGDGYDHLAAFRSAALIEIISPDESSSSSASSLSSDSSSHSSLSSWSSASSASSASSSSSSSSEPNDQRHIIWNDATNFVPALTPPTITESAAVSRSPIVISMSCDVEDAIIRYTLNGRDSAPNLGSHIYTGPFTVYQPTVIKACWYYHGLRSRPAKTSVRVLR